ncbi:MAG TPA: HAD family hydrolase [Actinomycetota bacterium]|nr:HAD family hydrolase [Actinomycetota bacterium]
MRERAGPTRRRGRPAVFLDRDGTLVEEVPYLHEPDRVALLPGVGGALRALAAAGFALVVVTNQAGVARGHYGEAAVAAVHRRLAVLLRAEGVRLDGIWYCPHHPDGTVAAYARACRCRKPAPGLLEAAAGALGLDLGRSWLVGNHPSDVAAGAAAGVTPLFVSTGDGATRAPPPGTPALPDLAAAAGVVLGCPVVAAPPSGRPTGPPRWEEAGPWGGAGAEHRPERRPGPPRP